MWSVRRAFWNLVTVGKFRGNSPQPVPKPVPALRSVRMIPMNERYPEIPITTIPVADHVPDDERDRFRLWVCKVQASLYWAFPPKKKGLRPIDANPSLALADAYGQSHRKVLTAPVVPEEFHREVDLGRLAVAGPYSYYLESTGDGRYQWDFRKLGGYEHHRGLRSLGLRVVFELDEDRRGVSPVEIQCELGTVRPPDAAWELAVRLALCAATNHMSLVRHFNWVHLVTVSHFSAATRNALPADHRLRRLLWPHLWGSQYSNELVTQVLLMKGGDFDDIFSFTHRGLCRLLEDTYAEFDLVTFDPVADATRRGVSAVPFDQPAKANRIAHFDVLLTHTQRYLTGCYPSDQDIRDDTAVATWIADLHRRIPGGVAGIVDVDGRLTVDQVARLAAIVAYVGTVEHEVMGTGLWNYQVWAHVQPVRVRYSGRRDPVDHYQRLVNYNFVLNVRRAPLMQDFSYMAVDEDGADAFRTLRSHLDQLQASFRKEEPSCWRVSPAILEVSVNG